MGTACLVILLFLGIGAMNATAKLHRFFVQQKRKRDHVDAQRR